MHQSGRPIWGWRETLALPRPQKIISPAHTPLKSDFYNKIGPKQTFRDCGLESAFGGKADITWASPDRLWCFPYQTTGRGFAT